MDARRATDVWQDDNFDDRDVQMDCDVTKSTADVDAMSDATSDVTGSDADSAVAADSWDDCYDDINEMIHKVALPYLDRDFQLYHELIAKGQGIKRLKTERAAHYKRRVGTTNCQLRVEKYSRAH